MAWRVRSEVVSGPGVSRVGAAELILVSSQALGWLLNTRHKLQFELLSIKLFVVMPAISEAYTYESFPTACV